LAKIIDPDFLNQNVEVTINTLTKRISLSEAGNLTSDGVTCQAIYSFLKEEWINDFNLTKFPFPIEAITENKFDLINGWDWEDIDTKNLIRDAGWALKDSLLNSKEEYMGFVTLGLLESTDQVYYQQFDEGPATNVVLTGPANQAVKIFGDTDYGNFDYRDYFKCFVREYGKIYDQSEISVLGVNTLTYRAYSFPLSSSIDSNIVQSDTTIDGYAPYTGMSITYLPGHGFGTWQDNTVFLQDAVVSFGGRWYHTEAGGVSSGTSPLNDTGVTWVPYSGERQINEVYYPFKIIINGNASSTYNIYEFVQRQLRKDTDIDSSDGYVNGKTASELLEFIGSTLKTNRGVFVDDFDVTFTNDFLFTDSTNTEVAYSFTAAGVIQFNSTLVSDGYASYTMFFRNGFETQDAIIVQDADGNNISGSIVGPSVSFSFDYDNNEQGGRTPSEDAEVVIVASGLTTAQYINTTGFIRRSSENIFLLVSQQERSYSNL
jgi:hypothetical protein